MSVFKVSLGLVTAILAGTTGVIGAGGASAADGQCSPSSPSSMKCVFSPGSTVWTVPVGVTSITVELRGSQGGVGTDPDTGDRLPGGRGGIVKATLSVSPREQLQVNAGNMSGYNGGGNNGSRAGTGGGASDVRAGGIALRDRMLVAGGGGAKGGFYGTEHGIFGNDGGYGGKVGWKGGGAEIGGKGAAADQGGQGGGPCLSGGWPPDDSVMGKIGQGGAGFNYGGGGGGGYYGGGGGSYCKAYFYSYRGGGGGGGSSYADPSRTSDVTYVQGFNDGNVGDGSVTVEYTIPN